MDDALKPAANTPVAVAINEQEQPMLGQRVLLAVPDVRSIYAISALLDEQGLQVVPATTAIEALKRFDEDAFDLALVDMKLPNEDGIALIRQLRNDYGCQVPIVVLTATEAPEEREAGLAAGADDWLSKPVESVALSMLLQRCLGNAAALSGPR